MSKPVLFALLIESGLITLTTALISQPRSRVLANTSGWLLLCLTFCWSVVMGCLIGLQRLTIQL